MKFSNIIIAVVAVGLAVFSLVPATFANAPTITADVTCEDVSGAATVHIVSSEDIANIVYRVGAEDTKIVFEDSITEYTLPVASGTTVGGIWVLSGDNASGDGPDYGEKVLNKVIAGTEDTDTIDVLNEGEVFCGGADFDRVITMNNGTFNGGADRDTVITMNDGTFNGGADRNDVLTMNNGTFNGGADRDDVAIMNNGTFNGGAENDLVSIMNNGTFNGGADRNDVLTMNDGTFNGGADGDSVGRMFGGVFDGGANRDRVIRMFGGVFDGGADRDLVFRMFGGVFDGGADRDQVSFYFSGTCIDVETGCL